MLCPFTRYAELDGDLATAHNVASFVPDSFLQYRIYSNYYEYVSGSQARFVSTALSSRGLSAVIRRVRAGANQEDLGVSALALFDRQKLTSSIMSCKSGRPPSKFSAKPYAFIYLRA